MSCVLSNLRTPLSAREQLAPSGACTIEDLPVFLNRCVVSVTSYDVYSATPSCMLGRCFFCVYAHFCDIVESGRARGSWQSHRTGAANQGTSMLQDLCSMEEDLLKRIEFALSQNAEVMSSFNSMSTERRAAFFKNKLVPPSATKEQLVAIAQKLGANTSCMSES